MLDGAGKQAHGIDHPRAGEFVAVAKPNAWFTYYYWLDDKLAPDFARTVDIHRKPGYDPVELFVDPAFENADAESGLLELMKRKAGFRDLLNIIPLDANLVKGSHGRTDSPAEHGPLFIGHGGRGTVRSHRGLSAILDYVFG